MNPQSRREQLLAQEVGNELIIYDERTHEAHRLNPTAALVWRLADGQRSTAELALALHTALQTPDVEDLVRVALAELDKAALLTNRLGVVASLTRRDVLRAAGYLLPVVSSIVIPQAVECASPIVNFGTGQSPGPLPAPAPNPPPTPPPAPAPNLPPAVLTMRTFVISDGDFGLNNWAEFIEFSSSNFSARPTRREPSGGSPGAWRSMEIVHLSVGTHTIQHIYRGSVFKLPPNGQIDTIDYSESRQQSFPEDHALEPNAGIVGTGLMLFLGNKVFYADCGGFTSYNWETLTKVGLKANDFRNLDGSATPPDFSNTTDEYVFGYRRATIANAAPEAFHHGIDNFTVTINYRSP